MEFKYQIYERRDILDEKNLIAELNMKNPDALEELMTTYGTRLLKSAFLILKDYGLAQDAVQEAFIQAYYKISLFREQCTLYTWIYSIMLNICRKKLRSNWLRKIVLTDEKMNTKLIGEEINISHMDLQDSLQKLNDKYRRIAIMFYFEDFSIREIAEITGSREGTIKSSLNRLRGLLKDDMLGGNEYDEFSESRQTNEI